MNIPYPYKIKLNAMRSLLPLLLAFCFPLSAFADTTFVSGAVSGEWTRDGNPYVVVDSTWIPDGERLTLREGVEVFLEEGQGLYVFGEFAPRGGPGGRTIDSVFVREAEGVENGRGLRFYGENHSTMDYLSVICPDTTLMLDDGCWLTFNHCTIRSEVKGVRSLHDGPIRSSRLDFNHSTYAGGHLFNIEGCSVNSQHSKFDLSYGEPRGNGEQPSAFDGDGITYEFSHSEVIGSLYSGLYGQTRISDCRFLDPHDGAIPGVGIHGNNPQLTRTYIEGRCSIGNHEEDSQVIIEDNVITGDLALGRPDIIVKDCRVGGEINIMGSASALIHKTVIGRVFDINRLASRVVIDSCLIGYNRRPNESIAVHRENNRVDFVRNVIFAPFYIQEPNGSEGEVVLDHNTIVVDSTRRENAIVSGIDRLTVTNNIFVNLGDPGSLYRCMQESELPIFKYNCLWGFDRYVSWPDTALIEPDSTNIIANPLLEWFGFSPLLAENSPCIDLGDPEAPHDPDGTRSDIGARYFHHEASVNTDSPSTFDFQLSTFPNPFNSSTTITFSLAPGFGEAGLRIYDLSGRLVADLLDRQGRLSYGKEGIITPPTPLASRGEKQSVVWDASGQAAGLYFCKVVAGGNTATTKVMLVK